MTSDLIYNGAHLYLQEHNLEGWQARLDELDRRLGDDRLFPSSSILLRSYLRTIALMPLLLCSYPNSETHYIQRDYSPSLPRSTRDRFVFTR